MSLRRVRTGDWLAGIFGLGLVVSLFLDWYRFDPAAGLSGVVAGIDAWRSFSVIDVILALSGLTAVVLVLVTAGAKAPAFPVATAVITTAVSSIAFLIVLYRHLNEPGDNGLVEVRAGAYLGLLCTGGIFFTGYLSMRDERRPAVPPPPEPELLLAPPLS